MRASTTMSPRLSIIAGPAPRQQASFAQDVQAGLLAPSKWLASKYFYDELGSALFDAITVLPEYYLTRAETEILRQWGWEIVRALGNPVEFVELGSGSAVKTRILIEEALRVQRTLRYSPIDISPEALRSSAQALVSAYPELRVTGYAADYFTILNSGRLQRENRMLVLFLGSNIGNYEPAQALELLRGISACLKPGDGLLLGADLKKDAASLERAYNDPTGVTAAFNKNVLARINRELGGNFDLQAFAHTVHYDEVSGAVKSYLQTDHAHTAHIGAIDLTVPFRAHERIHTESSYKYSLEDIEALGVEAKLSLKRTWMDRERRFSVNLFVL
ncbi:MAG TPA: L-histidine N(alpha)-methyltransferase [Candidatus Baltobacteraceae bacterium]|jgi:dimethylhistidine N-methyltransferase|nr:L-histidine N(alpha)-methyltransferase [Candidatus Baltobacteraceae bacterium]